MKLKWLIIGNDGVGKTSLSSIIEEKDLNKKKSLDFQYRDKTIEAPEGFIENSYLNNALIMVGQNQAKVVVFMLDDEKDNHIPPNFAKTFTRKTITIINKIDLYDKEDMDRLREIKDSIGSEIGFEISLKTGEGVDKLKKYIEEIEDERCFL
ncbi:EutP/PduV family microcompartment system protein [Anaerococcus porci]|uniref:Ethanolamine utilization protein EutP n=1 Tax=Anaerococcus porci TaxID=2652269 RepID=A0A6N7VDY2_9FIRM|nr:EutP/PduV family microcompartment system protein [Anaerococcus porci]MDY3007283.1 EutP/PduV family microcompartment system protein [Anaerococcus porci]MSS77658.1 ethanolamine utilization protein EutP [Anaerococcus porci]